MKSLTQRAGGGKWPGRQQLIAVQEQGLEKKKNCKGHPASATRGGSGSSNRQADSIMPPNPQPQRRQFCEILPRATPGFAKICMLFDNYILLIKQFYRLSALGFSYLSLFCPLCHPPTFSDKRVQRQIGQSASTQRDLRSPPQLTPPPPEEETAQERGGHHCLLSLECSLWEGDSLPGWIPSLRKKLKWFQSNPGSSSPRAGPMLCCEVCSQLLSRCHPKEGNWRFLSLGLGGREGLGRAFGRRNSVSQLCL